MKNLELAKLFSLAIESEGDKTVFLLTKKETQILIESNFFSPALRKDKKKFDYFVSWKNKKYYVRKFTADKFVLFVDRLWNSELGALKKLKELEKAYRVVRLTNWIRENNKKVNVEPKMEKNMQWELSLDDSAFFDLSQLAFTAQRIGVVGDWAFIEEIGSVSWSLWDSFSELDERVVELTSQVRKKEKKRVKNLKLESHFSSKRVFSNPSDIKKQESTVAEEDKEIELLELLPSPVEEYKEILSQMPKSKIRGRYFNSHFPFATFVDVELNNSHYFWTSISSQYKGVDSFALKLREHYCALSPRELEALIESEDDKDSHVWKGLQSQISFTGVKSSGSSFKDVLDTKLKDLRRKNEDLSANLQILKEGLIAEGRQPESDMLYLHSLSEKKMLLEEIEKTFELLNSFEKKMNRYCEKNSNFSPTMYLSIFGPKAILSKYDSLVCETLFSLNDQFNEIVFYQKEIERVLFERLSVLHRARKSELKLQFLAEEESLKSLVFKKEGAETHNESLRRKKELELRGALELSKCNIQEEIEREKAKLSNYLERLQELDCYTDYEEQAQQLRERKAELAKKVESYREEIFALKLRAEAVEREYSSFIDTVKKEILSFQKEISGYYSSHLCAVNNSVSSIWTEWLEQGMEYIEKILSRKKKLVREFSEIIVLELKNMYVAQDALLAEARERKREWDRVYREIVDEFKTLGYYLSEPKPSEYYYKYLPKLASSALKLSPEIKKLIYYKPSLKYITPKVNELIGLSPKLLDSKEFLVLDQVWTKLTPFQEQKLKEKLKKDAQDADKERVEELFKKTKSELAKKSQLKDYSLKTLSIERDFPLESDQEEREKQLKETEAKKLENWRELHFTASEIRYKFSGLLSHFSKRLFTLKGVEQRGRSLNITDTGKLSNPEEVERLSEWDYFTKSKDCISLVESCSPSSFRPAESELYDIEDESYLSILEALEEDKERVKEKLITPKKPLMPTLEEWANLNLRRYKEEKKKVDILDVKEGLLSLEKEIKSLQKVSGNYREACEIERSRREQLASEISEELEELKKYFVTEEEELHRIFAEASDMIELSFEKIDRELDERKKRVLEFQKRTGGEEFPLEGNS